MRTQRNMVREKEIINDYWILLSLRGVGKKYHISGERVRQILEREGINCAEIKKAINDYNLFHKIEAKYKTCKCGKHYILDIRRARKNRVPDMCSRCFLNKRAKLDGYRAQRAWQNKNPEKVKSLNRAYYRSHKNYFLKKTLNWIKNHPEKNRERVKRYYYLHKKSENKRSNAYYHSHKIQISIQAHARYLKKKHDKS